MCGLKTNMLSKRFDMHGRMKENVAEGIPLIIQLFILIRDNLSITKFAGIDDAILA